MSNEEPVPKKKSLRGYYILIGVLAANVLLMFGLIWLSEINRPELVEPHYYTSGSIDSVKKQMEENKASGWRVRLEMMNQEHYAAVRVFDDNGPVYGLEVYGAFYRPSSDLLDRPAELFPEQSSVYYGLYTQRNLKSGLWNLLVTIQSKDGKRYRDRIPFIVKPYTAPDLIIK